MFNVEEKRSEDDILGQKKPVYNMDAEELIAFVDQVRNSALMDMADFFMRTPEAAITCKEAAILCATTVNRSIEAQKERQKSRKIH